MPAEATCPHCQLTLRVPENYGGKSVKCPQCQRRFTVGAPGGALAPPPPAPVATAPKSNSAAFDDLVLSMLDEDEEETPAAASVAPAPTKPTTFKPPGTPAAAPSTAKTLAIAAKKGAASHYWRCPKCQALWEKRPLAAAALENTRIKAKVRCETCGAAYDYQEVHSGQYDAAEVSVACGKCHLEFSGPAEDLLGQPCPACGAALPKK
jgi:uncharacterized CHY-type Zn-finger protein